MEPLESPGIERDGAGREIAGAIQTAVAAKERCSGGSASWLIRSFECETEAHWCLEDVDALSSTPALDASFIQLLWNC